MNFHPPESHAAPRVANIFENFRKISKWWKKGNSGHRRNMIHKKPEVRKPWHGPFKLEENRNRSCLNTIFEHRYLCCIFDGTVKPYWLISSCFAWCNLQNWQSLIDIQYMCNYYINLNIPLCLNECLNNCLFRRRTNAIILFFVHCKLLVIYLYIKCLVIKS